jgi:hypothetical protein
MKAISLWEPWASAIWTGAKTWETRSWPTAHRGPLMICAAKAGLSKSEVIHYLSMWHWQGALAPLVGQPLDLTGHTWAGVELEHLNFGKAVALVELVDCKPTGNLTLDEIGTDEHFGDFSLGRFAWKLKLLEAIEPFAVKGHQGFFNVPYEWSKSHA